MGVSSESSQTPSVDRLIEYLRSFQKRKPMYVHPVTVPTVQAFLWGFKTGCHALGFELDPELWWTAQEARGWERSPSGPVPQMEARGLSETEIMGELIAIEIDRLRAQGSRDARGTEAGRSE